MLQRNAFLALGLAILSQVSLAEESKTTLTPTPIPTVAPLKDTASTQANPPKMEEELKVTVREKKEEKKLKVEDVNPYQVEDSTQATKTNTPLRDIPASVVVLPKQLLEDQGATNLDQVIQNVSSLTQTSTSNYGFFNNYLSRGLAASFLRDGVADGPNVNGYNRSLTNVERVEVYKGPGSALFGSLQPGGSVNLVTKAPLNDKHIEVSSNIASYDTYKENVDVGGAIIKDKLLTRLNLGKTDVNGYRGFGQKTLEIMPSIEWRQNENHSVRVDFDYRNLVVEPDSFGIPYRGVHIIDEDRSTDDIFSTRYSNSVQEIYRGGVKDTFKLNKMVTINNNFVVLRRETDILRNAGGSVANVTATAQTGRALRKQYDETYDFLYQLEPVINFDTGFVHHQLLTGYEYQRKDWQARRWQATLPNITNLMDPLPPEKNNQQRLYTLQNERHWDADFHALYAQDQIKINDKLKVRVGIRGDRFDIETYDTVLPVTPANGNNEDANTAKTVSVNAGLVYQPWKFQSFYFGYGTSHNATISTESAAIGVPESGEQYEIGSKTSLWGGKLTADIAFYNTTRKNFFVTIDGEPLPVGKQATRGMDIDFAATPIKGWNIRANYAFQDAHLIKVAPVTPLTLYPTTPTTPLINVKNNRPTGIPVNSGAIFSTYTLQDGPAKGLGFSAGMVYKDETWFDMQNVRRIPGYTTFDASLSYEYKFMRAQFGVKNFTDEKIYTNGQNSGAKPGDPRTFWGAIRFKF